jgi:hypothetical protein
MEGFLPDGVMEVFGYAALSLLDDVGNRRGAHCAPVALEQKQQMHMVGHDRVFFQMHHFGCNHIPANGLALLYDTACRSPNIKS